MAAGSDIVVKNPRNKSYSALTPVKTGDSPSIAKKRGFMITVRLNMDELEKLESLSKFLGYNTSQTIRTAIDVFHGLVAGQEAPVGSKIVVQNPNIIINNNNLTQSVSIDPKILEEENKVLRREKEKLKEIVKFYEGELEHARRDLKELEKRIKTLESENKRLAREAGRISDLEDTNKRLHAKLTELKNVLEEIAQTSTEEYIVEKAKKTLANIYSY